MLLVVAALAGGIACGHRASPKAAQQPEAKGSKPKTIASNSTKKAAPVTHEASPIRGSEPTAGPEDEEESRPSSDIEQEAEASAPPPPNQKDVDDLVRAVLQREQISKRTLPDMGLLPKQGPIYVLSPAGETVLTRRALPGGQGRLRLASIGDLQAMADERNDTIAFVVVRVSISGKVAEVTAGVDILLPTSSTDIKMCCCKEFSRWAKERGRWQKQATHSTLCS